MIFHDRALIDGPARITREGHLVATARVARANNIQDYQPHEIGQPAKADGSAYRIFRPESAVFAKDAIASAAHRPITINHPAEDVTASNWKQLAVGDTGGDVMRDGEFLRIPVMVMDARGVEAAQKTHREFSLGYSADLSMVPGRFGDAEYDGYMENIRVNHLALCGTARGGADLRIVDERPNFQPEKTAMKIKIGDAEVDLSDGAAVAVAIGSLNAKLSDATSGRTAADALVATHVTTIAAKDAEIVTLKQAVTDATVTPAKMRDAAKAFAATIATAKALAPAAAITDAMDEAAIKSAVVTAKLGDAAKGWTDAQIDISFATMAAGVKVDDADPLRDALIAQPQNVGDAATAATAARKAMIDQIHNPHAKTGA